MSNAAWRDLYQRTILETDWVELQARIAGTERAIAERSALGSVHCAPFAQLERAGCLGWFAIPATIIVRLVPFAGLPANSVARAVQESALRGSK
jgi:hypothetical protein